MVKNTIKAGTIIKRRMVSLFGRFKSVVLMLSFIFSPAAGNPAARISEWMAKNADPGMFNFGYPRLAFTRSQPEAAPCPASAKAQSVVKP